MTARRALRPLFAFLLCYVVALQGALAAAALGRMAGAPAELLCSTRSVGDRATQAPDDHRAGACDCAIGCGAGGALASSGASAFARAAPAALSPRGLRALRLDGRRDGDPGQARAPPRRDRL
ncbi:MAG: hypothetical protein JNK46_07265 [Methylobacteriaceae bacterium]|nr:hypothetical protein [Methylobacteriaceae bacterium]